VGSSLNQRAAEFSLCNTLVLLLDLAFKQPGRNHYLSVGPSSFTHKLLRTVDLYLSMPS
jgi:hypothetical protein